MHNYTNSILVIRTYYFETARDVYDEVEIQEYIFKKTNKTRRYCLVWEKKGCHVYEVTEHSPEFFDNVVRASNGPALFHLYFKEKIDPVPHNEFLSPLTLSQKYRNLKEFYTIFNCTYNEKGILSMMKKNKKRSLKDLYQMEDVHYS